MYLTQQMNSPLRSNAELVFTGIYQTQVQFLKTLLCVVTCVIPTMWLTDLWIFKDINPIKHITYLSVIILLLTTLKWANLMQVSLVKAHLGLERIKSMAFSDYLTGVANRNAITQSLQQSFVQARKNKTQIAVILMDIDYFKRVNDNYGHDVGDRILIEVANLMNQNVRANCNFGRWGGEEFLFILEDSQLQDVISFAQSLRQLISEETFQPVGKITASFGIALLQPQDTIGSLTKRADIALYRAKAKGRNCVEFLF